MKKLQDGNKFPRLTQQTGYDITAPHHLYFQNRLQYDERADVGRVVV